MTIENWQQWAKRPNQAERTLIDRALGNLPEMESTKQLVKLISHVYKSDMRILDAGCNVGHYLRGLRKKFPVIEYTGIDAYAHYIEKAKDIFKDDKHTCFEIKDILKPLYPDNPFDIVFCCNVLFHLPDFRLAVKNLLDSTTNVCFIRLMLSDSTSIVKLVYEDKYDKDGNPLDYRYYNTWNKEYFVNYVHSLGWNVELIPDEFDPSILQKEFETIKTMKFDKGTRIMDGKQVIENIITNYVWVKITPL